MKDSWKRYIMLIAIFVVLIIIALIVLLIRNINKEDEVNVSNINTTNTVNIVNGSEISNDVNNTENNSSSEETVDEGYENYNFAEIYYEGDYFKIKDILSTYYTACWDACGISFEQYEERSQEEMINEGKTSLKNILAKEYIQNMNLNDDDIIKKAEEVKNVESYSPDQEFLYSIFIEQINVVYLPIQQEIYLVDYQFHNQKNQMLIKVDTHNNTFEIYLNDYIEKHNLNNEIKYGDLNISEDNIKPNDNNAIIERTISNEDMTREYFLIYKNLVLNYNGELYAHLDSEYKSQHFKDYSDFQQKIQEIKNNINSCAMVKYKVNSTDDKYVYRIIDNMNNEYEITVDSGNVLEYSIKLYDKNE